METGLITSPVAKLTTRRLFGHLLRFSMQLCVHRDFIGALPILFGRLTGPESSLMSILAGGYRVRPGRLITAIPSVHLGKFPIASQ